jgi:serine/threonine protein kinase
MGEAQSSGTQPGEDPLIGRTIGGKYEIVSFVGRGGMGAVYKAKQAHLKRPVAIKVLHPQHSQDGTFAGRFRREATSASRLDHPNLMRVLDFGQEPDGLLYLAMEYLDGRDLLRILREEGVPPPERVVDIMGQVLAALAIAHDEGIVHRDLKPENIMIVRGKDDDGTPIDQVKVCDFGIAKSVSGGDRPKDELAAEGDNQGNTYTATLTATGALVGTPEYMSPEQAKGESLDARSDLYAVGVMLYLLLCGRLPFQSSNSMKVVLAHVSVEPKPPSRVREGVDPRLEAVCLRALKKDRDDRFATAREMRAALRGALGIRDSAVVSAKFSLPPPASPSSPPPPQSKLPTREAVHDKDASTLAQSPQPAPAVPTKTGERPISAKTDDDEYDDETVEAAAPMSAEAKSSEPPPVVSISTRPPANLAPEAARKEPVTARNAPVSTGGLSPTVIALLIAVAVLVAWLVMRR